jgi:hypothetical protein
MLITWTVRKKRKKLILWFNTELLYHTIERGRDATGITVSLTEGEGEEKENSFLCLKQPADATDFFENDGTEYKYNTQEDNAAPVTVHHSILSNENKFNFIIGHTRKKTQGSEYNVNNNHPIIVGNIIGIQNGGVENDDRIFKLHEDMERQGEVDSEAIMQLLALHSNDGALDWESINYVTKRMEGPRAVMAYNSKHPEKIIFFRDSNRPIELYYLKELGAVLICSKIGYMNEIKKTYQRLRITHPEFPKMTYETVNILAKDGGVIDIQKEYDSSTSLRNFLEVKKYDDNTIDAYSLSKKVESKKETKTTPSHALAGYPQNCNDKDEGKAPFGPSVDGSSGARSSSASEGANETTYVDHSIYDDDNEVKEVEAAVVMDDPEDETPEPKAEDKIFGRFTTSDLRDASFALIQDDSNYLKEEDTLFSRSKNFEAYFDGLYLNKKHHGAVVSNLYPEIHSDGFVAGVKFCENIATDYVTRFCEKLDEHAQSSTSDSKKIEAKLKKASYIISNLKVFIMCLLKMEGMVDEVSEDKEGSSIQFSEDLEVFMNDAEKHLGLDMDRILRMFTTADYDSLAEESSKARVIG